MPSKLVKCRSCGVEIARSARRCPGCGARHMDALTFLVGLAVAAAIGVLIYLAL